MTVGEHTYEAQAAAGLAAGDWAATLTAAQSWVMAGGAWLPDTWLLRAVSQLLHDEPVAAVRELDLGLRHWVRHPGDRAPLLWARGVVQLRHLADPGGAAPDFAAAAAGAPVWLRRFVVRDQVACSAAACRDRRTSRAVPAAPAYDATGVPHDAVAPPDPDHTPGAEPALWAELCAVLDPVRR